MFHTQTSKDEATSIGLNEWSVWCDIRDENNRTIGSVYGHDTVEENETVAKRIAAALNAHDDLVKALTALRNACVEQDIKFGPLIADADEALAKAAS